MTARKTQDPAPPPHKTGNSPFDSPGVQAAEEAPGGNRDRERTSNLEQERQVGHDPDRSGHRQGSERDKGDVGSS